jgi:hypothetical protein
MSLALKAEQDTSIALGPLLGIESDSQYTVCCLINSHYVQDPIAVELQVDNQWINDPHPKRLREYWFFRFDFKIQPEPDIQKEIVYRIGNNKKILSTALGISEFKFRIPPLNKIPDVAFVSCCGTHKAYPKEMNPQAFQGWENMLKFKPDFLFLTGDQVYADPIWDKIEDAKEILDIDALVSKDLEDRIDAFYLNLYIDYFSKEYYSEALATIPNIMTWDDHEIIDGYGSHKSANQDSHIFKCMFKYAKMYFEYFQIRSSRNTSLLNYPYDYTLYLNIRNYSFILPDTRSYRTREQILDKNQYLALDHLLYKRDFVPVRTNYFPEQKNMYTICFVLPVPIAHRNYSTTMERIFSVVSGVFSFWRQFGFGIFEDDDLVDHWDHPKHEAEQKQMLDLMFKFAAKFKPKNLLIVSGDVHSGGAATVIKKEGLSEVRATQIITSPIVNQPVGKLSSYLLGQVSKSLNRIPGYVLDLKNFGTYEQPNITARNYVIISVPEERKYPVAKIYIQENDKWPDDYSGARSLNNYQQNTNLPKISTQDPWLG